MRVFVNGVYCESETRAAQYVCEQVEKYDCEPVGKQGLFVFYPSGVMIRPYVGGDVRDGRYVVILRGGEDIVSTPCEELVFTDMDSLRCWAQGFLSACALLEEHVPLIEDLEDRDE